jgi:hypothetical protein
MIISSMNRFFTKHGRKTFLVIAGVIIVTFVFFMTGQSVFSLFSERYNGAGDMDIVGRSVSLKGIQNIVDDLLIQQAIGSEKGRLGRADYRAAKDYGVRSLMLIYTAEDAGLAIGDKEVAKAIEKAAAFQENGKFSKAKYEKFIKEELKPRYFTKSDLDQAIRNQLLVEKLTKSVTDNVVCSEKEVKDAYVIDNTKNKVQTLEFSYKDYIKDIKVTDSESKSYFESNKDKYMTQPGYKILAVAFAYDDFKGQALKEIKEEDIKKYYEEHKNLYLKKNTSKDKKDKKKEYKPLKEVAEKIKTTLASKKSKDLASKAATKYSDTLYDMTKDIFYDIKDDKKALAKTIAVFKTYSVKNSKKAVVTDWFYKGDVEIKGLGKEPKVVKVAQDLYLDNPLSLAIKGSQATFVILLTAQKKPESESFVSKKKDIIEEIKKDKAINLAREKARNASLKFDELFKKGEKFQDICKKLKLTFKPMPFEVTAGNPPWMMNGQIIQDAACSTPDGKVSSSKEISNGAILVYIEKRTYPTLADYDAKKKQFTDRYKMMKQYTVWGDFVEGIAAKSNIKVK